MIPARYGDVSPNRPAAIRDEWLVLKNGHQCWRYEEEKARRVVERMQELGGANFRTSCDITHMLIEGHTEWQAHRFGFHLTCDQGLPPNSIIAIDDEH